MYELPTKSLTPHVKPYLQDTTVVYKGLPFQVACEFEVKVTSKIKGLRNQF